MDNILRNVADLPASARSAVETLMGHPLRDEQRLFIVALDDSARPTVPERQAAWEQIRTLLDEAAANVARSGLADEAAERLADETCEAVRYGAKPCE